MTFVFRSLLFQGDGLLMAIANDEAEGGTLTRISRVQHRTGESVTKVQTALLDWDPNCLPAFGADGTYGAEAAAAVRRFKIEELGVPPQEVVDDVGPKTVARLDEIRAQAEKDAAPRTRIDEKYDSLLAQGLNLGQAVAAEETLADGGSRRQYEFGIIYFHPRIDEAFEVHGLILSKYLELGEQQSELGYPITDEVDDPDVSGGRMSVFEGGALAWEQSLGVTLKPKAGETTTLCLRSEYGDPLPNAGFTVCDAAGERSGQTDTSGHATVAVEGPAQVVLDTTTTLQALGDLLDREWPPDGVVPGLLTTPRTDLPIALEPGGEVDIVVASRAAFTAPLTAPLGGSIRIGGTGVRVNVDDVGQVTVGLQANGGLPVAVFLEPTSEGVPPLEFGPLTGWSPPDGYVVRSGDTAPQLAEAFLGDPERFAELSDHDPVPGEILKLPPDAVPAWLELATEGEPAAPAPQPWFETAPDDVLAAFCAHGDMTALHELLEVIDRPPPVDPDPVEVLNDRAAALASLMTVHPPIGRERIVEFDGTVEFGGS